MPTVSVGIEKTGLQATLRPCESADKVKAAVRPMREVAQLKQARSAADTGGITTEDFRADT
jgi:hypothetical protein